MVSQKDQWQGPCFGLVESAEPIFLLFGDLVWQALGKPLPFLPFGNGAKG